MGYLVTLKNHPSVVISNEAGEDLKTAMTSINPPRMIELKGDLIKSTEILSVEKHTTTEPDWLTDEVINSDRQLEAKRRCRGQYSIQNEINRIAISMGKNWGQYIKDLDWRDKTRQKLLKSTDEWCDYKTGMCNCDEEFMSYKERHDTRPLLQK